MSARHWLIALVVIAVAGSSACGSSPTTPTTTTTSPTTESWTGLIGPNGSVSRSFLTSQSGTITATLTTSDVPLGIGIGVPRASNGGCRLDVSQFVIAPGVSVSTTADTGTYCVQLFDEGNVVTQAAFSVQIVYP